MASNSFTPDESARLDAVRHWGETAGQALAHFVAPICARGPHHPDPVGSGVLLQVDGEAVLVTAAHVLDDVGIRPLSFGAAGTLLPIAGWRSATQIPEGGTRANDRIDLAFVRLVSDVASQLAPSDLLDVTALDTRSDSLNRHSGEYFVVGYPATRQPRRMVGDEFEARPFTFITEEASEEEYLVSKVHRGQSFLLHFEKADVYRDGQQVVGPDLCGASGGAVWRLPAGPRDVPLLAGVITTWRKSEPTGIIATRARTLWDFLASRYTQLREL